MGARRSTAGAFTSGMSITRIRPSRARAISLTTLALWLSQSFLFAHTAVGQTQRDGDFRVGDQIVVYVRGDTSLSNTFVVQDGIVLKLPNMPDVALKGAKRAEAEDRIRATIGTYLRNPEVRVSTLIRVGVLGQVVRPGYYQLGGDVLLSDALMAAGGPTPIASEDNMIVRHGAVILWKPEQVRERIAAGATLAQLGLHSGDEIVLQDRPRRDWSTFSQISAAISGVLVSVVYLTRR